jgi:hypothetical protein
MGPRLSQCARHLSSATLGQQRPDCIDCSEPHARGCTGSENAEHEFFPKTFIRAALPHFAKLVESGSNFLFAQGVCRTYVCRTNGLIIYSHAIVNVQILGLQFFYCQRNRDREVYQSERKSILS